uniref:Uncharacterized protein n=1 Tax=Amphimedon queenslandica TaxID=400682 RepID=A0A1X7TXZ3_AMPQE
MRKIHETGHPLNFYDDNGDLKSLAALADRSFGNVVLLAQLHPIDLLLYADTMLNLLRRLLSVSNLALGLRKTYLVDTEAEVSTIPPNKLDRQEGPAGLSLQAANGSQISTCIEILSIGLKHVWLVSCQKFTDTLSPLSTFRVPDVRFDNILIDIVGPLPSSNNYSYLLTCIDKFICWPKAIPMVDNTAATVAQPLVS